MEPPWSEALYQTLGAPAEEPAEATEVLLTYIQFHHSHRQSWTPQTFWWDTAGQFVMLQDGG